MLLLTPILLVPLGRAAVSARAVGARDGGVECVGVRRRAGPGAAAAPASPGNLPLARTARHRPRRGEGVAGDGAVDGVGRGGGDGSAAVWFVLQRTDRK